MNSRRSFLKSAVGMSSIFSLSSSNSIFAGINSTIETKKNSRKVHVFSKHLQWLDYFEMAKTANLIGFDGIDITVRQNGHVLPENVKTDLPKAINAVRKNGLIADRITSSIINPDDHVTIDVLKTAASEGIKYYRLGWIDYDKSLSIKENIKIENIRMKKLADLNRKFGIKGSYQNHAGEMFGASVWDLGLLLDGIDSEYLGIRYDIRHATVEGTKSWPVALNFVADKINSFDLKDFTWAKDKNDVWQPVTVPLGEGNVDFNRFFSILKDQNIEGDITLHFEYELGGADTGASIITISPNLLIQAMKRDLDLVRSYINII